jgi:hypothetical protein
MDLGGVMACMQSDIRVLVASGLDRAEVEERVGFVLDAVMQGESEDSLRIAHSKLGPEEKLDTPLAELECYGLTVRTISQLGEHLDVHYVYQFVQTTARTMKTVKVISDATVKQARMAVRAFMKNQQEIRGDELEIQTTNADAADE